MIKKIKLKSYENLLKKYLISEECSRECNILMFWSDVQVKYEDITVDIILAVWKISYEKIFDKIFYRNKEVLSH